MIADRLTSDLVFPFPLDAKTIEAEQPLFYRPWGTRTIKLRVTADRDLPRLRILPQAITPEDRALGIFKAYADDSRALHITWGGGHVNGPCVKTRDMLSAFETPAPLRANDSSHLFFNLTHAGATLPPTAAITCKPSNALTDTRPTRITSRPVSACRCDLRRICRRPTMSYEWFPQNATTDGLSHKGAIYQPMIRAGGPHPK